ncbi:MAG: hypothetical protein FWD87_03195 [Spirochaetaceae bacterium]|nr:hypothetical protein [Spirochaetaceae bacterium]
MCRVKLGLFLLFFLNAVFSVWAQGNQPSNVARITFAANEVAYITRADYLLSLNENEQHKGRALTQDERLIVVNGLINELLLLRAADLWFEKQEKETILNEVKTLHEEKFAKPYNRMSTLEMREVSEAQKAALIQGYINSRMISVIPKPTEQEILNFHNEHRQILVQPNTNRTMGLDEMLPNANITVRTWISNHLHRQRFLVSFMPTEQEILNFYNENRQHLVRPGTNTILGLDEVLPNSNMIVRNWIINFITGNRIEASTYRLTLSIVQEFRSNVRIDYYNENF